MRSKPLMTKTMKNKQIRKAILGWRNELEDNRGERARLRRCREPKQVLLHSTFYRLKVSLPDWPSKQILALAAVAGLIANAKFDESNKPLPSFPQQLGSPKSDGGPIVMSEARFYQLIKSRDWEEFYRRMRRAILMLKASANILSIADFTLQFGYELGGNIPTEPSRGFQYRLAEDYFEAKLNDHKAKK